MRRVVSTNIRALSERDLTSAVLSKYAEAAVLLTGREDATTDILEEWLAGLCEELRVPGLATYGLVETSIPGEIAKARRASSMKGNPIELTDDELTAILRGAM